MSKFFEKEKKEIFSEKDVLETGFIPNNDQEAEIDVEEANAKKKELLQSFTGKRFTEIARNADNYADSKESPHINKGPQLINIDALEFFINKIVEEKNNLNLR